MPIFLRLFKSGVRAKVLVFLILTCGWDSAIAQDFFDEDTRFWLYMKLNKRFSKNWRTQFIFQNRFNNNVTEFSQINANGEVAYLIRKNFRILGGAVYGQRRRMSGHYNSRYQAYSGFIFKQRVGFFKFRYRNLLQVQMSENDLLRGRQPSYYDRNKFTLQYEINKRWEIYAAYEFNLPLFGVHPGHINRTRTFAGLCYTISKKSYLESYFLFQQKFGYDRIPPRDYIYGITYGHNF